MPAARTRRVGGDTEVIKRPWYVGFQFNRMVQHGAGTRRCALAVLDPGSERKVRSTRHLLEWVAMRRCNPRRGFLSLSILAALMVASAVFVLRAQTPAAKSAPPQTAPAWAQPGSATHKQVPPPAD